MSVGGLNQIKSALFTGENEIMSKSVVSSPKHQKPKGMKKGGDN